jgi:hypothetical protein
VLPSISRSRDHPYYQSLSQITTPWGRREDQFIQIDGFNVIKIHHLQVEWPGPTILPRIALICILSCFREVPCSSLINLLNLQVPTRVVLSNLLIKIRMCQHAYLLTICCYLRSKQKTSGISRRHRGFQLGWIGRRVYWRTLAESFTQARWSPQARSYHAPDLRVDFIESCGDTLLAGQNQARLWSITGYKRRFLFASVTLSLENRSNW